IDINQLLDEISTSARSASDPWTLSRNRGTVSRDPFRPGVVADLAAPLNTLNSEILSSEQIEGADAVNSRTSLSTGSGQSSGGSGFFGGLLGGLLNAFPFAKGIASIFGLDGSSSSAPVSQQYQLPPSISFEGALSGQTSGVSSLSYGADGLPRI